MILPMTGRWWPLGLVGLGALVMLVLGDLPRSVDRGQRGQADWVLPGGSIPSSDGADQAWAARQPWGSSGPQGVSSSSDAAPQAQAVGVVQGALGLQAVFEIPGQPLVRVQEGDDLPGGGVVARVSPRQVDWTTPEGEPRSRRLLVDPLPSLE